MTRRWKLSLLHQFCRHGAFTLIELLVVIAISASCGAVAAGTRQVQDNSISNVQIPKQASSMVAERLKKMNPQPKTHAELLSQIVPDLRNEYFHGSNLLGSDFLHLTFQMRELADALSGVVEKEVRKTRFR